MTLNRTATLERIDLSDLSSLGDRDRVRLASDAGIAVTDPRMTLARLCDKAIEEWTNARNSNDVAPKAITHIETFIGVMRRASAVASAVRRDEAADEIDKEDLPSHDDRQRLNAMRQAIEQIDTPSGNSGKPGYLILNESCIEMDRVVCSYDELAWWLAQIEDVTVRAIEGG